MNIGLVALVLTSVFNLTLGGVIFIRNRRRIANVSFLCMSVAISLWMVSNYITNGTAGTLTTHEISNKMAYVWGYLLVLFGLFFTYNFPRRINTSRLEVTAVGIMSTIVLCLSMTRLIAGNVTLLDGEVHFSVGPLLWLFIGAYIICVGLVIRNLLRSSRKTTANTRLQAQLVLLGFAITASLGIIMNLIIPVFAANWQVTQYTQYVTVLMVITISYAMIKHGLFDIRLVVARSVAYLATIAVLSTMFGFLVFGLLRLVFDVSMPLEAQIFISIATSVAALGFARLKKFFDKVTNRLFYADAYDPQSLFDGLNAALVRSVDLDQLLQNVSTLLATELKSQFCVVGIREIVGRPIRIVGTQRRDISSEDIATVRRLTVKYHQNVIATDYLTKPSEQRLKTILANNDVAVLVRLSPKVSRNEEGLGYLAFGPKKSGNPYNTEDFRVLDTVAKELIIAIQNALHFEEIQNFNETLQDKVAQATRELRRTNEKLKSLDETKDDFISMASHQLRTPLTSVKGYLSLVIDGDAGPIKPAQEQLLNQAFISSQRMVYLISDLLNVSRLKTGKFVIQPSEVNLADVISDEIEQLKETAASRAISVVYDKPVDFPGLQLDETKIRQVVMNFMDNAIYYTPSGGKIRVELRDTGTMIELKVVDNGIGVPRSEQHHLFTKFYRAANARQARPDGTGLGLFMAKKVITAQGGAIIFSSKEDKGSTFGFVFHKSKLLAADTKSA